MTKEQIIALIDQIEREWIEDIKGHKLPWNRFNGYKWLTELKRRIEQICS